MEPQINFDLNTIQNIEKTIQDQVKKFQDLRDLIKGLKFITVDSIGTYSSVTYKSIDGGQMGIYFDPFEFDFIVIADSLGNELLKFLVPKSELMKATDFQFLDDIYYVREFLNLLNLKSIVETSDILLNPKIAMELTELACIFERLSREKDDPIIVMKDGLLRTRALKYKYIGKLIEILKNYKKRKLVGVAKRSKVLNLIASALYLEKIIPYDYTGYIEIPWEIERLAYKRSKKETHLYHSFGKLYLAKLSKSSNLLVTLEIPYDFENDEMVYSRKEINEIFGHLIKDSRGSYPVLGYPQTIMRAHEKAVRYGFTASIWREKIIDRILNEIGDFNIQRLIIEGRFLREYVKKGMLGGF